MVEQSVARNDPDPKALACYGLLVRTWDDGGQRREATLLRCVEDRPLSAITTQFLAWSCNWLAAHGTTALLLVWDNASWHVSRAVRTWIRAHNQQVKTTGQGVRLLRCQLPTKSPWLNPIEPKWVHGKRKVVEPNRLLTANELADRIHAALGCPREPHLRIPDHAA